LLPGPAAPGVPPPAVIYERPSCNRWRCQRPRRSRAGRRPAEHGPALVGGHLRASIVVARRGGPIGLHRRI